MKKHKPKKHNRRKRKKLRTKNTNKLSSKAPQELYEQHFYTMNLWRCSMAFVVIFLLIFIMTFFIMLIFEGIETLPLTDTGLMVLSSLVLLVLVIAVGYLLVDFFSLQTIKPLGFDKRKWLGHDGYAKVVGSNMELTLRKKTHHINFRDVSMMWIIRNSSIQSTLGFKLKTGKVFRVSKADYLHDEDMQRQLHEFISLFRWKFMHINAFEYKKPFVHSKCAEMIAVFASICASIFSIYMWVGISQSMSVSGESLIYAFGQMLFIIFMPFYVLYVARQEDKTIIVNQKKPDQSITSKILSTLLSK